MNARVRRRRPPRRARALACALLACAALVGGRLYAAPARVVSINLCADQLLLLTADPGQVAALSFLSHDPAGSRLHERARRFPTVGEFAEDVLQHAPDLVLAGTHTRPRTVRLLERLGVAVERLPIAESVAHAFMNVERVAALVGHPGRGAAIVADMRARLDRLEPPPAARPLAAIYDPNGYTAGRLTLRGQAMELAGWRNAATLAGIDAYGTMPLETVVRLMPTALIDSPYGDAWSRARALSLHPALRGARRAARVIAIPGNMTICAGPWTVDVIEILQRERLALDAGPR